MSKSPGVEGVPSTRFKVSNEGLGGGYALVLLSVVLGCAASERPKAATPAASYTASTISVVVPAEEHECPCKAKPALPPQACSGWSNAPNSSCFVFNSPQVALRQVLYDKPQILAVGETHALAKYENVLTTTTRFRNELLPELKGFQSLLMEALLPPQGCAQAEKQVREQTAEVTKPQAATNQNEFLVLANQAKERGITPYPLRLSCADLKAINDAGEDGVEQSLRFIAEKTTSRAKELIAAQKAPLLIYGGVMHNDVAPKAGHEAWSFGTALSALPTGAGTSYIELDLITREYIADRAPWTEFEWYPAYLKNCNASGAILIHQSAHSYVLIFPWQSAEGSKACPQEI